MALLLAAVRAAADPGLARLYRGEYGYVPSCNACHRDGGGSPLNPYGEELKRAGRSAGAFRAIEAKDSDGDGAPNRDEAKAKANPGSPTSTPTNPGDWLSTENLIPKEIREAYPEATAFKLLDAIVTARERERAQALGVELTERDENVIYVPLKENKAIGAAIIVPTDHAGRRFFLLVAVDRRLAVAAVKPIDTRSLADAASPGLYASYAGKSVSDLPAPGATDTLTGAVAATVKKAGTILYVRLKQE